MQRTLRRAGRERDADAARAALLDAAQEIFARDGFSGARVDDIAQHAGYNKALIFHYFGDKLGLYRALMAHAKQHLFARFEQTFDRLSAEDGAPMDVALAPEQRIRALVGEYLDALFDLCAERPQIGRILAWEAAEGWQAYVGCPLATPHRWPQRALALLRQAQAAGAVRPDLDPLLLLTTMISLPLIHLVSLPRFAAMFPEVDFSSAQALAHAREQLTELLLRGILAPADAMTPTKTTAMTPTKTTSARAATRSASHTVHTARARQGRPARPTDHTNHTNLSQDTQDTQDTEEV